MQRRDVFGLAGIPLIPWRGLNLNASITNGVVAIADARVTKQPNIGDSATYYEGRTDGTNHLSVGTWRVEPGKSPHGAHTHPEEELLVFTEGTGEVSIEDKHYRVAPGAVMYCAGNLLHGVYNTGQNEMLFYFIKWKA